MRVVVLLAIGLFAGAEAAFDCKLEGDGLYAVGCSSKYLRCKLGVPLKYTCPPSLMFNPDNAKCDHAYKILLCKEVNHNTIVKAHHVVPGPDHPKPTEQFACAGKPDGVYTAKAGECTQHFWKCAHGVAFLYRCPSGLYFNVHNRKCDYKHEVPACSPDWRHHHHHEKPHHHHEKYEHHGRVNYDHNHEHYRNHRHYNFNCDGKADGSYALAPCINTFGQCSGGVPSYQKCADGLVYAHGGPCVHKKECGKFFNHHHDHEKYKNHDHHHHHFKCHGKADGSYALGHCINTFAQCSGGVPSHQKCPTGLVYAHGGPCVHKEVCEKHHLYHHGYPDHHGYHHGYPGHYGQHHGYPGRLEHHHDHRFDYHHLFNCKDKKDGYYIIGHCHASFLMCSNEIATEQHCPKGLVFHFEIGACDYYHNCVNGPHEPWASKKTMHPKAALSCEHRKDGPHHLHSCSQEFFLCWAHRSFSNHCPADLIYNKLNGRCDFKHNVLECGVPVLEKFCASKPDGTYVVGCKDHYYTCVAGTTHKQRCPPTLYYSKSKNRCETKANVPECKP